MRLGISRVEDLGRYLGVRLIHKRKSKATHTELLDKFNKRLTGWKAKCLSLAGHITLAKVVLNSQPVYQMQTSLLPADVAQELKRRTRRFVRGGNKARQKLHLISWARLCKSKQLGVWELNRLRRRTWLLCQSSGGGCYRNQIQHRHSL